jgi:hypothetical protein
MGVIAEPQSATTPFVFLPHPKRTVISTEAAHALREQRSGEIRFSPQTLPLQHTCF